MGTAPVIMFVVFAIAVLTDSGRESQVILLPDPDGTVGVVEVSTKAGSAVLSKAGQMTKVSGRSSRPSAPISLNDNDIRREYADLFAVEPPQPAKYLLYFEQNSSQLVPDSLRLLPQILEEIQRRQSYAIGIYGHSDRTGSEEYNLRLSLQRAVAVSELLEAEGVGRKSIDVDSHGEGNPLISTADGVAEPRNRRVEVIVR